MPSPSVFSSVPPETITRALAPYAGKNCQYMQQAEYAVCDGQIDLRSSFAIEQSAYIDDTGHFNAAEFFICYSQSLYVALATVIEQQLIEELHHWTLNMFYSKYLPHVLISSSDIRFSSEINPRDFVGTLTIRHVSRRNRSRPLTALTTHMECTDSQGGHAGGIVKSVLIDP